MSKASHIKALHEAFLSVKPIDFYGQQLYVLEYTVTTEEHVQVVRFKLEMGYVLMIEMDWEDGDD